MMSRLQYLSLGVLGLTMAGLSAAWVTTPGYMDADYYYAAARQLVSGGGLSVPFLWNYLATGNLSLPQPAHLYWMPLTTFMSAGAMAVFGDSFRAAQLPSLAFTAVLPLVAAWLARRLGASPFQAMLAGGLAALSGFYLPFFATTDAFSSFAVIGGLALWLMARAPEMDAKAWLFAGGLAGLGHLARADGVLLLLLAIATWGLSRPRRFTGLLALAAGYLVVMAGWFVRMWKVTGGPLSPGGLKAAWLTDYNQLFSYPTGGLTPAHWLESGFGAILQARLQAAGTNLVSLLLVNGLVFLTVLMVLGLWRNRRTRAVRVLAAYLLAEFTVMTVVFPFPGERGGFFHSSTAAMPLLWALAPQGLDSLVEALQRRWDWQPEQAIRRLGLGTLAIAGVATLFLLATRQIVPAQQGQGWGQASAAYSSAVAPIRSGGSPQDVVAVNNPPAFWLASGHPSVVIPAGNPASLQRVVRDFGVRWVVLEKNHPPGLEPLYEDPTGLRWLALAGTTHDAFAQPVYTLRVVEGALRP